MNKFSFVLAGGVIAGAIGLGLTQTTSYPGGYPGGAGDPNTSTPSD